MDAKQGKSDGSLVHCHHSLHLGVDAFNCRFLPPFLSFFRERERERERESVCVCVWRARRTLDLFLLMVDLVALAALEALSFGAMVI